MNEEFKADVFVQNDSLPQLPNPPDAKPVPNNINTGKLVDALADNMDSFISLGKDFLAIQKIKVKSEADLKKIEKQKEMLLAEAEAYILKKNADTKGIIDRMQMARIILQDFYTQKNTCGVSAEDFALIINALFEHKD